MKSTLVKHGVFRPLVWGVVIWSFLLFAGGAALSATIKGTVTNGTAAIEGLAVAAYNEGYGLSGWKRTDSEGGYIINNLPAGSYKVVFYTHYTDYIGEWYTSAPHAYTFADAETVTLVSESIEEDLGSFTLQTGANITGTVTDESTTNPIENISVVVYDSDGNAVTNAAPTPLEGTYDIGGLRTGTYYVQFWAGNTDYASEWYSDGADRYTRLGSTSITISALSDVFTADNALGAGGAIAGKVTYSSNNAPVVKGLVEAYDADDTLGGDADSPIGFAETDGEGTYTIKGLPTTKQFKVRFSQFADGGGMTEWYDDQQSYADADEVAIDATGIDGTLGSSFNWLLFIPAITHRPTAP